MMIVPLDKKCGKCGVEIKQNVSVSEKDGKLKIEVWQDKCPNCRGPLKKPTLAQVRRADVEKK